MSRAVVIGVAIAIVSGLAAYVLTYLDDPGPMGRPLATSLGLCLTAAPGGVAGGLLAGGWKRAAAAAITAGGLQLVLLGLYCALVWKGSWDLPALVSFAVLLQAAAMLASGGLTAMLRARARLRR